MQLELQRNVMTSNSQSPQTSIIISISNIFFHIVHLTIILFFLFGWIIEETLLAHFILSVFILLSWFGLGVFYGFGYCLVTDIQWKIKKCMGQEPYTKYYIKYMLDKVTGLDLNPDRVNSVTECTFYIVFFVSTFLIANGYFNFF